MNEKTFEKLDLKDGEIYVGAIGDRSGLIHHVILLPGVSERNTYDEQVAWADSIGGKLPNNAELSILFFEVGAQFEFQRYWSSTQRLDERGFQTLAYTQDFANGSQAVFYKNDNRFMARAVRRVDVFSTRI